MLAKSLIYKKDYLTIVNEEATSVEVLKILEDSGFRCVPILDDTRTTLRENIYKMHIYRHKSQGGDMNLPATYLFKNATKAIKVSPPFFHVFSNIKDLPCIAVLDERNHFYGILIHVHLLDMLSDAWNTKNGFYVLAILSDDDRDNLVKTAKIISKYSNIAGYLTLDVKTGELVRRNLFTLSIDVPRGTTIAVINRLEKKGSVVPEIEDLRSRLTIRSAEQPGELKDQTLVSRKVRLVILARLNELFLV